MTTQDPPATAGLEQAAREAQDRADLDEALRLYLKSLELHARLGDERGVANSLYQLAQLEQLRGNQAKAIHAFRRALELLDKLGSPYAEMARAQLERLEDAAQASP